MTAFAIPTGGFRGSPTKDDGSLKARVLRNTKMHFDGADGWFRRVSKQDAFAIKRAMWKIAHDNAAGRRNRGKSEGRRGDLYDLHARLVEWMIDRSMTWATGRLEPTYSEMCRGAEMSKATIARLIKDLVRAGILEKRRRWRHSRERDRKGQAEQAPNAYRFNWTRRLRAATGRSKPAKPKPTQHEAAEAVRREAARQEAAARFDRLMGPVRPAGAHSGRERDKSLESDERCSSLSLKLRK